MNDTRVARAFFGATSLIVTFALVLQLYLSVTRGADEGPVVLLNVSLVAVLFLVISFGALALDRVLPGVRLQTS